MLEEYVDVFDTKVKKSMNAEPVKEATELVNDLLDQNIIAYCRNGRSE